MKTFIFMFNDTLYKAQGNTGSSILQSMFTTDQLSDLKFEGYIEYNPECYNLYKQDLIKP